MTTADAPPSEPQADRRAWSTGRIAAVMAVLAMVLFWLWIWSGAPAKDNPDKLKDASYVASLETRCKAMVKAIGALPPAQTTPDPVERAEVLDQANAILTDFVADLRAGAPTSGPAAKSVDGWLDDWETYVRDRKEYAAALREDPKARLLLDQSPLGDSVDKTVQIFAEVNQIPDCSTPGDVI